MPIPSDATATPARTTVSLAGLPRVVPPHRAPPERELPLTGLSALDPRQQPGGLPPARLRGAGHAPGAARAVELRPQRPGGDPAGPGRESGELRPHHRNDPHPAPDPRRRAPDQRGLGVAPPAPHPGAGLHPAGDRRSGAPHRRRRGPTGWSGSPPRPRRGRSTCSHRSTGSPSRSPGAPCSRWAWTSTAPELRRFIAEYAERMGRPHLLDIVIPPGWPVPLDWSRARFRRRWIPFLDRIIAARQASDRDEPRSGDLLDLLAAARNPDTGARLHAGGAARPGRHHDPGRPRDHGRHAVLGRLPAGPRPGAAGARRRRGAGRRPRRIRPAARATGGCPSPAR